MKRDGALPDCTAFATRGQVGVTFSRFPHARALDWRQIVRDVRVHERKSALPGVPAAPMAGR